MPYYIGNMKFFPNMDTKANAFLQWLGVVISNRSSYPCFPGGNKTNFTFTDECIFIGLWDQINNSNITKVLYSKAIENPIFNTMTCSKPTGDVAPLFLILFIVGVLLAVFIQMYAFTVFREPLTRISIWWLKNKGPLARAIQVEQDIADTPTTPEEVNPLGGEVDDREGKHAADGSGIWQDDGEAAVARTLVPDDVEAAVARTLGVAAGGPSDSVGGRNAPLKELVINDGDTIPGQKKHSGGMSHQ